MTDKEIFEDAISFIIEWRKENPELCCVYDGLEKVFKRELARMEREVAEETTESEWQPKDGNLVRFPEDHHNDELYEIRKKGSSWSGLGLSGELEFTNMDEVTLTKTGVLMSELEDLITDNNIYALNEKGEVLEWTLSQDFKLCETSWAKRYDMCVPLSKHGVILNLANKQQTFFRTAERAEKYGRG